MPVASATESQSTTASPKAWTFFRVLRAILMLDLWFGGMFLAAGTVRWLRGWIFVWRTAMPLRVTDSSLPCGDSALRGYFCFVT